MMSEYVPIINLVLNMLIIPLLGILWSIRIELARVDARLTTIVDNIDRRLIRVEVKLDKESS